MNLGVGGVAETAQTGDATTLDTVTVTAPMAVETRTSEVATYVTQKKIEDLPQGSRNFLAFADTVPGMLFSKSNNGESQLRSVAQGVNKIKIYNDGVGQNNYVTVGGFTGQVDKIGRENVRTTVTNAKLVSSLRIEKK